MGREKRVERASARKRITVKGDDVKRREDREERKGRREKGR